MSSQSHTYRIKNTGGWKLPLGLAVLGRLRGVGFVLLRELLDLFLDVVALVFRKGEGDVIGVSGVGRVAFFGQSIKSGIHGEIHHVAQNRTRRCSLWQATLVGAQPGKQLGRRAIPPDLCEVVLNPTGGCTGEKLSNIHPHDHPFAHVARGVAGDGIAGAESRDGWMHGKAFEESPVDQALRGLQIIAGRRDRARSTATFREREFAIGTGRIFQRG